MRKDAKKMMDQVNLLRTYSLENFQKHGIKPLLPWMAWIKPDTTILVLPFPELQEILYLDIPPQEGQRLAHGRQVEIGLLARARKHRLSVTPTPEMNWT